MYKIFIFFALFAAISNANTTNQSLAATDIESAQEQTNNANVTDPLADNNLTC
jgi:hypothetical protein